MHKVQNARIQNKEMQSVQNVRIQNVQYISIARTASAPEEDRYSASCQQSLCSGRRRPQPRSELRKLFCFLESLQELLTGAPPELFPLKSANGSELG